MCLKNIVTSTQTKWMISIVLLLEFKDSIKYSRRWQEMSFWMMIERKRRKTTTSSRAIETDNTCLCVCVCFFLLNRLFGQYRHMWTMKSISNAVVFTILVSFFRLIAFVSWLLLQISLLLLPFYFILCFWLSTYGPTFGSLLKIHWIVTIEQKTTATAAGSSKKNTA